MLKIKKSACLGVLAGLMTASAHAALPGTYAGATLGWGTVHQGNFANPSFVTVLLGGANKQSGGFNDSGAAGRIFGGYQFNQHWAVEMGYSRFSNATANSQYTSTSLFGATQYYNTHGTIKTQALDLVGIGILPLTNGFNFYGKLGFAYENVKQDLSSTVTTNNVPAVYTNNKNNGGFYPTLGLGISYDLTPHLVADLSWNHIQTLQMLNNIDDMSTTDMLGIGLAYHFG